MEKNLFIDASHPNETRVVLKSGDNIEDYEYEGLKNNLIKNNIYLGKVSRVEPSLQAAFIDFGRDRHGFLSFNDIQSDYYQIPQSDLEKIKEEEERAREELQKESEKEEEKDITEGNLDVNDPVEVKFQPEIEPSSLEASPENGVNTIENSTPEVKKPEKRFRSKRYKIQEVIKPNQVILIQVLKDERGQKGAALSTFISIAGKYIVLMPNTPKGGGISRKIFNPGERKKIRTILNDITIPKEMGLIVRTAGSNKTKNEIDHDLQTLIKTWNGIKENALNSLAPSLIHQESDIIKRTLRDMYDENTNNIIIEGNDGYKKAQSFMKLMMPSHVKKIKKYREKVPLFFKENIEEKLNEIYDSEIKLKSGGYLVINPTEALVAIDINSGQSTKQTNIEKTALNTNLEAAEEIARQIKLRDLSGLIVIDFIDMMNFYNRRTVEKKMRESIRKDRARIQVGRISNFGLLEMTRQRLREGSIKWETILSLNSFAQKIIKKIELLAFTNKVKIIKASIPEKVKLYIENKLSKEIEFFAKKYLFKIDFLADAKLIIPEYKIELLNKSKKIINTFENIDKIKEIEDNLENNNKVKIKKIKPEKIIDLKKAKKTKIIKKKNIKPRTLWVRRRKKA